MDDSLNRANWRANADRSDRQAGVDGVELGLMPLGAEAIRQAFSADAISDSRIGFERLAEVAAFHIPGGMGMALPLISI